MSLGGSNKQMKIFSSALFDVLSIGKVGNNIDVRCNLLHLLLTIVPSFHQCSVNHWNMIIVAEIEARKLKIFNIAATLSQCWDL